MTSIVLSRGLYFDVKTQQWITLEATNFDNDKNIVAWAIRRGQASMSKLDGRFTMDGYYFDNMPIESINKTITFKENRFETEQEAFECWEKYKLHYED